MWSTLQSVSFVWHIAVSGVKRARITVDDDDHQPSVHFSYKSLTRCVALPFSTSCSDVIMSNFSVCFSLIEIWTCIWSIFRASKNKLQELLQQWSQWHAKNVSSSNVSPIVLKNFIHSEIRFPLIVNKWVNKWNKKLNMFFLLRILVRCWNLVRRHFFLLYVLDMNQNLPWWVSMLPFSKCLHFYIRIRAFYEISRLVVRRIFCVFFVSSSDYLFYITKRKQLLFTM